ncbi:MAG: DUF3996 domain-containing protein [Deltaproteobacteria bacterium]|nr:DUF3996 domain-containing protein [Deltaproteobacteria bacterium]
MVFLLVAIGVPAWAGVSPHGPEGKRFGLGIVLGDPTGLTGKGYVSERLAVDGIVSWSFIDEAVTLIGDVTYDFFDLSMAGAAVGIPFYAGVGGKVAFDERGKNADRTLVGIRVPVGLAFQWAQHPIELFIEVAPGIELAPATTVDITGGLGARFYF